MQTNSKYMCKNYYKIGYVVCDWRWNILSFFREHVLDLIQEMSFISSVLRSNWTPSSHLISSTHLIARNPLGGKAFSQCLLFALWWTINNQHSCLEIVMCDARWWEWCFGLCKCLPVLYQRKWGTLQFQMIMIRFWFDFHIEAQRTLSFQPCTF